MSCNWCRDEEVALSVIAALCEDNNDIWKQESNPDLCFCTPCVREYHRVKRGFIKEHPECEKKLYQIEVERLRNHFLETLNQRENQRDDASISEFPYDIEDYLKVPLAELLQYPYLLFNSELMSLFVSCLVLLIENEKFDELEEKHAGIYLLLANPCSRVRKWALKTAKDLGSINMEDFQNLSPIINCLIKVVLYGLLENHEGSETWPIPMSFIDDETNPLPHLYYPLSKKDLWLGLGTIFHALEENVIRMLMSTRGNCQVLEILKDALERKDADSEAAFWPLLFTLRVLMQKLESTFWLLTTFDDAPTTTFRVILQHRTLTDELRSLAARCVILTGESQLQDDDDYDEEISLSQLSEKCDDSVEDTWDEGHHKCQPFFWVLPYIVTVLDLEDLSSQVIGDVLVYLMSLVQPSLGFWAQSTPTELDYTVLSCLCNLLKYLIEKKLICLIKDVSDSWLDILYHLRFGRQSWSEHVTSKKWIRLLKKVQSIFISMLTQAEDHDIQTENSYLGIKSRLRLLKPTKLGDEMVITRLKNCMPEILTQLSEISLSGLSAFNLEDEPLRLFSFSSQDDSRVLGNDGMGVGDDHVMADETDQRRLSSSKSPIFIIDSDDDNNDNEVNKETEVKSPRRSVIEPLSYDEDLDYSEEADTSGFDTDAQFSKQQVKTEKLPVTGNSEGNRGNRESNVEKEKYTACVIDVFEEKKQVKETITDEEIARTLPKKENNEAEAKDRTMIHLIESSDSDCFSFRERPPVKYQYGRKAALKSQESREPQPVKDSSQNKRKRSQVEEGTEDKDIQERLSSFKAVHDVVLKSKRPKNYLTLSSDEEPDISLAGRSFSASSKFKRDDDSWKVKYERSNSKGDITKGDRTKVRVSKDESSLLDNSEVQLVGTVEVMESSHNTVPIMTNEAKRPGGDRGRDTERDTKPLSKAESSFVRYSRVMTDETELYPEGNSMRPKKKRISHFERLKGERSKSDLEINSRRNFEVDGHFESMEGLGSEEALEAAERGSASHINTSEKEGSSRNGAAILSPVRKKGLFDFIGEIKGGEAASSAKEDSCTENATNKSERALELTQNEDNIPAHTDSTITETEAGRNDVAPTDPAMNLSKETFQKRKSILYDQFVKKRELRSMIGESEANSSFDKSMEDESVVASASNAGLAADGSINQQKPIAEQECLPEVRKHKSYTIDSLLRYILTWHPFWLNNEQQDELEIHLPCDPRMIQHKYHSYDDYMFAMWPLVLIEFFAQVLRDKNENESPELHCKFKSFDEVIESQYFRIMHCVCLQEVDSRAGKDPAENDLVVLICPDEHTTEVFGVIEEVEKTPLRDDDDPRGKYSHMLISLKIKVGNLSSGIQITDVQVKIITSMISLFRRWEALIRMPKSLLAGDILNPFRPQVYQVATNQNQVNALTDKLELKHNPGQANAISKITDAVVQAFPLPKLRLLQGPPGTGKTHTLKGLVKNILQTLSKRENSRILICAPSNAAVDEIASRLLQDPPRLNKDSKENNAQFAARQQKKPAYTNCGDFNLLRIGSASQINPKVSRCSLDYLVQNELNKLKLFSNPNAMKEELHKIVQNLKQLDKICTKLKMSRDKTKHIELKKKMVEREREQRHYEDLQKRSRVVNPRRDIREEENRLRTYFLTRADIICCTLSGSGSKHMVNTFRNEWNIRHGTPFACVIIDEAGQCCEPEALIPLQYGSSKLVLVGDPAQLPATVLSRRAFRYGYGQSLFERIQGALQEHFESPVLFLEEQYRMHPGICAFPSQKFYDGNLITAREVVQRRLLSGIKPFVVLNISGGRETKEAEGAIHNPEERKYVTHIGNEIIKRGIITAEKIGVITPYRKQLRELRNEMRTGPLSNIEVNTIDGFQGREKDIIILSCVRAQKQRSGIGFLEDPQRMNVALTRAKQSIIVLVHSESLQVDEDWRALIDFANTRDLLFNVKSIRGVESAVFVSPAERVQLAALQAENAVDEMEAKKTADPEVASIPLQYEDLSDDETTASSTRPKEKAIEKERTKLPAILRGTGSPRVEDTSKSRAAPQQASDQRSELEKEGRPEIRQETANYQQRESIMTGRPNERANERESLRQALVVNQQKAVEEREPMEQDVKQSSSSKKEIADQNKETANEGGKEREVNEEEKETTAEDIWRIIEQGVSDAPKNNTNQRTISEQPEAITSTLQNKVKETENTSKQTATDAPQDKTDSADRRPVAELVTSSSDAQRPVYKLPHRHNDGTKCVEKCLKASLPPTELERQQSLKESSKSDAAKTSLQFPHNHRDGTRCVDKCLKNYASPRKISQKSPMEGPSQSTNTGDRSSEGHRFRPHVHSDGTKCKDRCLKAPLHGMAHVSSLGKNDATEASKTETATKANPLKIDMRGVDKNIRDHTSPNEAYDPFSPSLPINNNSNSAVTQTTKGSVPPIHMKLPHTHSDGTKCVDKCSKRAAPSGSYFKFPHTHSDGTECIKKCVRVEQRERARKNMEKLARDKRKETSQETVGPVGEVNSGNVSGIMSDKGDLKPDETTKENHPNISDRNKQENIEKGIENISAVASSSRNIDSDVQAVMLPFERRDSDSKSNVIKSTQSLKPLMRVSPLNNDMITKGESEKGKDHDVRLENKSWQRKESDLKSSDTKSIEEDHAKASSLSLKRVKEDCHHVIEPARKEETIVDTPHPPVETTIKEEQPPPPPSDPENYPLPAPPAVPTLAFAETQSSEDRSFWDPETHADNVAKLRAALYEKANAAKEAAAHFPYGTGFAPAQQWPTVQSPTEAPQMLHFASAQNMQAMQNMQPVQIMQMTPAMQNIPIVQNVQAMQIMQVDPNMQNIQMGQGVQSIPAMTSPQYGYPACEQGVQNITTASLPTMQAQHQVPYAQYTQNGGMVISESVVVNVKLEPQTDQQYGQINPINLPTPVFTNPVPYGTINIKQEEFEAVPCCKHGYGTNGTGVCDDPNCKTPEMDSRTPELDSQTPVLDPGTPELDSRPPVMDPGTPELDSYGNAPNLEQSNRQFGSDANSSYGTIMQPVFVKQEPVESGLNYSHGNIMGYGQLNPTEVATPQLPADFSHVAPQQYTQSFQENKADTKGFGRGLQPQNMPGNPPMPSAQSSTGSGGRVAIDDEIRKIRMSAQGSSGNSTGSENSWVTMPIRTSVTAKDMGMERFVHPERRQPVSSPVNQPQLQTVDKSVHPERRLSISASVNQPQHQTVDKSVHPERRLSISAPGNQTQHPPIDKYVHPERRQSIIVTVNQNRRPSVTDKVHPERLASIEIPDDDPEICKVSPIPDGFFGSPGKMSMKRKGFTEASGVKDQRSSVIGNLSRRLLHVDTEQPRKRQHSESGPEIKFDNSTGFPRNWKPAKKPLPPRHIVQSEEVDIDMHEREFERESARSLSWRNTEGSNLDREEYGNNTLARSLPKHSHSRSDDRLHDDRVSLERLTEPSFTDRNRKKSHVASNVHSGSGRTQNPLSKVEEITQRIRERNALRNKGTQLLDRPAGTHPPAGRRRIVRGMSSDTYRGRDRR